MWDPSWSPGKSRLLITAVAARIFKRFQVPYEKQQGWGFLGVCAKVKKVVEYTVCRIIH